MEILTPKRYDDLSTDVCQLMTLCKSLESEYWILITTVIELEAYL